MYKSFATLIPLFIARTSAFSPSTLHGATSFRTFHQSTLLEMARKVGVSSPEELKEFVSKAGEKLLIVDARNSDASIEPSDQKSLAVAGLPSSKERPKAVNLVYNRESKSMSLPEVEKNTPIITHCGGGGRGQKAKDFLIANGFTNVINGGGPKETDCWVEFGSK